MDEELRRRLSAAKARGLSSPPAMPCKICPGAARPFDVVDFAKFCNPDVYAYGMADIAVRYDRCDACGLLFTRFFDDWTAEDFGTFVYDEDYATIDPEYLGVRPRGDADRVAQQLADWLHWRILDFGSGTGIFADAMRARGFDAESYDPFTSPARPEGRFDLVTCFEVLEHSPDPLGTVRDIVSFLDDDGIVLFGTSVQPDAIAEIRASWWYVGPRNGHVSIYTHRALHAAGAAGGLVLHVGRGMGWSRSGSTESARRMNAIVGDPNAANDIGHPLIRTPTRMQSRYRASEILASVDSRSCALSGGWNVPRRARCAPRIAD